MLRLLIVLLLALGVMAPCADAQAPADSAVGKSITLRPGDVIKLSVWREKDLTGEFLINEAGVVTLPLLGPRQVTGIALPELRAMLIKEFNAELRNPAIEITPLRRISVLGEVNSPGQYEVDPTTSLASAIALAHGPTGSGNLRHIRIVRQGRILHERVKAEATLANVDIRSGDQIFVERRSWVSRNSGFLASTSLSIAISFVSFLILK